MSAPRTIQLLQQPQHPDALVIRAAEGWLDLGSPEEANLELESIPLERRTQPDVLALQWHISAELKQWDACRLIARGLTQRSPQDQRGWIALAQTFYFTGDVRAAYKIALEKVSEFPGSCELLYNLACYACSLGNHPEARQFLDRALAVGDAETIRRQARTDPDLQGLL